jgi:citrate lyase beta subunit
MYVLDKGTRFVIPRTEMTYPGHNMKLHVTAADAVKAPVDHVMADFEDACPYEFKGEKSRKVMVEALNTLDFGKKVVTVRPNNIHSKFFKGDMEAIVLGAPNRFHGIMLPKTRGPEEIREVSKMLDDLEKRAGWKYRIQIESLIETPHALSSPPMLPGCTRSTTSICACGATRIRPSASRNCRRGCARRTSAPQTSGWTAPG